MSTNFKSLGAKRCISPGQAARLKLLITEHVNAAVDASWAGIQPPNIAAQISHRELVASKQLDDYITKLRGGMTA